MADISKCEGEGCDLRDTCWRYLAPANEHRQSWLIPDAVGEGCEYYWEMEMRYE